MKFQPRIEETIQAALKDAKLELKDLDDVELLGSGLRVPFMKDTISAIFKVSTTRVTWRIGGESKSKA